MLDSPALIPPPLSDTIPLNGIGMFLPIFSLVGWVGIPPLLLTVAAHLSIHRIGLPLPPVILSSPAALAFLGTADRLVGPVRRRDKRLPTVHASTAPHAAQDLGQLRLCRPDVSRAAVRPTSLHRTPYSPELGIVGRELLSAQGEAPGFPADLRRAIPNGGNR
jgi:hypothetical protein